MASYKSRAKRKIKNKIRKSPVIVALLLVFVIVAGLLVYNFGDELGINIFNKENVPTPSDGEVMFHFIDVGQGDAILVTAKSGNMIVDSGDLSEESRKSLTDYLKAANITSFKYAVFTHTDADHIGSADYIVNNYDVENVIMPFYETDTAVFDRLLTAIENKNVNTIYIGYDGEDCKQSGYTFYLGSMLMTVMAPTRDYNDANEMSVVLKCSYGETSVMLTGDAEEKSEDDMINKWGRSMLDCDVLKVGHHGSDSSTTKEFLDVVSPSIAVISCGEGNKYGHPHKEILDRLEAAGVTVLRTDIKGHIVIKTDGATVTVVE